MHEFFEALQAGDGASIDKSQNEPQDIFFSLKPPPIVRKVDAALLDTLWSAAEALPKISIKTSTPVTNTDANSSVYSQDVQAWIASHKSDTLSTNSAEIWSAIAGHGQDNKRVPASEFTLLCIIAEAGPKGILQPDLVAKSGQDKRSVPKRTDALAKKAYITKEPCLGIGIKTSILKLKKLAQAVETAEVYSEMPTVMKGRKEQRASAGVEQGSQIIFQFEQWYNDIFSLLKANDGLVALADLWHKLVSRANMPEVARN